MVRSSIAALLALVVTAACGDDGTPADGGTGASGTSSAGDDPAVVDADGTTGSSGVVADDTSSFGSTTATDPDTTIGDATATTGGVNTPPDARNDSFLVVVATGPLLVDAAQGVLVNDDDPDGDAITLDTADATSIAGGIVDVALDGGFSYTPPADFWGEDEFGYTIVDAHGATASARVRVVVAPTAMSLALTNTGVNGFAIDGIAPGDQAGYAVAIAGDVDGDGYDDVLVGAPQAAGLDGRAYVVFGKTDGSAIALADVANGIGGFAIEGALGERAGFSADGAGDVNGDGLADLVIGAPAADAGAGRAYVVFGKADGDPVMLADVALGSAAGFAILSGTPGATLGTAVAGAGDVDGDGRGDIVIGAPEAGALGQGEAYVVFGTDATTPITTTMLGAQNQGFAIVGAVANDDAGDAVAGLGDVNADGLADVGVGAPQADPNGGNSGAAYVVFGRASTASVALGSLGNGGFVIRGGEGLDQAGTAIDGVGDVDGDGRSDIIVGAPGAENGIAFAGRAYLVNGKATAGPVELADVALGNGGFAIDGQAAGDFVGLTVAGLSDMDADGFADLALGVVNADYAGSISGRTYVVWGKSDGAVVALGTVASGDGGFALDGQAAGHESGWSVGGGGDIDGDGHPDLVIGAPAIAGDTGRVYVVFGGDYRLNVTHFGGAGADELVGSGAPDVLVSADGADVLRGLGGPDVLYAGRGDDVIELGSAQFFRLDAGHGSDTIALTGAGITLDLTFVSPLAIRNVQTVDLTGTGANTIVMNEADVRGIVGSGHTLVVLGDADDIAIVDLGGGTPWVSVGVVDGIAYWTNGTTGLAIATAVTANVTL